jgi:hypothetical protein
MARDARTKAPDTVNTEPAACSCALGSPTSPPEEHRSIPCPATAHASPAWGHRLDRANGHRVPVPGAAIFRARGN